MPYSPSYYLRNKTRILRLRKLWRSRNSARLKPKERERGKRRRKINPSLMRRNEAASYRRHRHSKLANCRNYYRANRKRKLTSSKYSVATLSDNYILTNLKQGSLLDRADLPPELIEAKRAQLQLRRVIAANKNRKAWR